VSLLADPRCRSAWERGELAKGIVRQFEQATGLPIGGPLRKFRRGRARSPRT